MAGAPAPTLDELGLRALWDSVPPSGQLPALFLVLPAKEDGTGLRVTAFLVRIRSGGCGPTRLCRGHPVSERAVHLRWFRGLCHLPHRGPHGNSTGQSARRWTMHSGRFGLGDGCIVHASSSLAQFKYVRDLDVQPCKGWPSNGFTRSWTTIQLEIM